jgi:metallophosphoesterase superfamily enzyme
MFSFLSSWRKTNAAIDVVLVRGNHDRRAGDPPGELCFECVDAPYHDGPFVLAHHPATSDSGYVFAGHVHPGIRLYGAGRQHMRLPCFVIGESCAILPAFGDFTGLADVEPEEGNAVYAIAGDSVIKVR